MSRMTDPIKRAVTHNGEKGVCLLLSGQGSQYRQMGSELYNGAPLFRGFMDGLDQIARQETGISIVSELYGEGWRKSDSFDQTKTTHPAIFMVQLSLARALMASGVRVDAVLGSSLGEYVGAVIAGAVDGEAMMRAVARSAMAVESHCVPGAMMSVLASEKLYFEDAKARDKVTFVGRYRAELFVISGSVKAIKEMHDQWGAEGVVTVMLPVSHAFHSAAMDDCSEVLIEAFSELTVRTPGIPFYSSLLGGQAERLDAQHFLRVGREPIDFCGALGALLGPEKTSYDFIDLGPFGSLAGVVKQSPGVLESGAQCYSLLSPFADSHQLFSKLIEDKAVKA